MKKILVTGGAGFIGSHTVVELYQSGYEPIIVDNFSNSEKSVLKGIEAIIGKAPKIYAVDCNDKLQMEEIFQQEKSIQGIIHFAAYKAVGESVEKPLEYFHNNLGSTQVLLELMLQYNTTQLVFSSSCTVYGQPEKLPVTEQTPFLPAQSPYGATKQMCEEILRQTVSIGHKSLKAISLRYFNPVGAHPSAQIGELPRGVPGNLVPFITQSAAGLRPPITVFGNDYNTPDGTCVRDFIHVVDLAKAHVKALQLLEKETSDSYYEVFNIGTGKGSTVLEAIHAFEEATGVKLQYKIGPRRSGDVEKIYAEVNKSSEVLNWHTELTLKEAMRDAWNWQKKLQSDAKQ
ncbi:UDP-glucose 4-epimerase GalE [Cytophagaceae bacterium YF14B1]|uniref:UDP-glucose 4-epimerase n=1 Tax=Xanthocytophaga flava TaxID=3048013 RepID=A0AAE3QT24_9BACT|nr:UDP-glucose 4-epimerase GalE [Xanthocytophaga flavus]MDJ1482334.1 UDP-glucose 4-epimerase GalE [Xanthocytophaga flavus]